MNIEITGRHVAVTEDLKDHARTRLEHVLRHHDGILSAHVILDVEKTRKMVEMVVHGRNLTAAVHADSGDHKVSIDRAADKMRHYLEHHLAKRRDKQRRGRPRVADAAAALAAEVAAVETFTKANVGAASAPRAAPKRTTATVMRMKPGRPKTLTVAEAGAAFEKGGRDLLVFRDADRNALSILYRRSSDERLAVVEVGED